MKAGRGAAERSLRRSIRSCLTEVDVVCGEIRALLEAAGYAAACFSVELATRECLCNAVIHGNRCDPEKAVHMDLRIGRRWIRLDVADEGAGFNWRRERKTPRDETISDGRGLAIYARYARRIAFNRRGNRVTLWIEKPKGGRACLTTS